MKMHGGYIVRVAIMVPFHSRQVTATHFESSYLLMESANTRHLSEIIELK